MTFWRGRAVFVTGASGLLGSWLVEALLQRGAEVTCLLRDWVPTSPLIAKGLHARANLVRGELEDHSLLVRALNEYAIDTIFHLGAQTIVGTAARSALSTFEANVRGTWNLCEAARACSKLVQRIVIASSDKAYGAQERLPYREDAPLLGRFPYDASKACAELVAQSYFATYGLPICITRCGNLYGGGDLNFNRLVPGTIRSILEGERPIVRSDGTFVREYFYAPDAAQAYLLLAERMQDASLHGEAFNFGTEEPRSVLELVSLILSMMDRSSLQPQVLGCAVNEIPVQHLDCTKARERLGWKSAHSLEQGLADTIRWYEGWKRRRDEGC